MNKSIFFFQFLTLIIHQQKLLFLSKYCAFFLSRNNYRFKKSILNLSFKDNIFSSSCYCIHPNPLYIINNTDGFIFIFWIHVELNLNKNFSSFKRNNCVTRQRNKIAIFSSFILFKVIVPFFLDKCHQRVKNDKQLFFKCPPMF